MDWAERTVAGIVAFCVRRARLVLTTYAALVVAALFSTINYLEINTDTRSMLSPDLPFQQRTIELESAFPHLLESIVIVLQSEVPDAADAVAGALVDQLTGQPGIFSAFAHSTDPFFRTHGLLYEDPDALREALSQLDGSAELLAALRATPTAETLFGSLATIHGGRAASDPATAEALDSIYAQIAAVLTAKAAGEPAALSWQNLLAGDAPGGVTTRLVQIMPELDYSQLQPAETALASINAALDAVPSVVGETTAELVNARVTGEPVLMFEELEAVADGIGLSLGASMIAVIFLLIVCYHSVRRTVATLVAIVVALCLALGFASIALGPLNLVSIAFVVPLVGLGLDFAIHVTTRAAELEKAGAAPAEAFVETGRGIALALGLSAFTTAAAFLSFVGTDFIGMGQVGVLGAVGVIIAFVISLTLVPALVTRGKTSAATAARVPASDAVATAAPAKGWAGVRNALTALLALAAVGSLFLAPQVRFDTDPTNLRDVESPSMVALAGLMVDPDVAPYRISLVGSADDVAAFADEADGAGLAHTVMTLDRLVPEDQDEKLAIAAEAYPGILERVLGPSMLPPAREDARGDLVSKLSTFPTGDGSLSLYAAFNATGGTLDDATLDEALLSFLPQLLDQLRAQGEMGPVDAGDLPEPLRAQFLTDDGVFRAEVSPVNDLRAPENRTAFVDEMVLVNPQVAGAPLEISRAGEVVSSAMIQATLIAAIVVCITCLLVLRSVRETLAVLLPLVFAGVLVLGAMVLLDLQFNYANVIVLPLIIGLGVDSSIHLAVRKRELDSGSVYATSTPRAVFFSGVTTAVAFVSLALSSHRGTASMGELLGLSIAIVLVTTILATPTLLDLLKRRA